MSPLLCGAGRQAGLVGAGPVGIGIGVFGGRVARTRVADPRAGHHLPHARHARAAVVDDRQRIDVTPQVAEHLAHRLQLADLHKQSAW